MKNYALTFIQFGFFTMLLLLNFSCSSDDDSNNSNTDDNNQINLIENFGQEVSRDFVGQIIDLESNPIPDATVKIGSATTTTDINGVFSFNDAPVYERFAHISASKVGYLQGSRSLVPTSGINNIRIMLIPSTPIATINSNEESEVTLPSGTKVLFDGSFVDEDGNAYNGSINVSMYHLLPSNPNISEIMPGMLYAQSASGSETILETYGMINVDLRGNEGQKIQLADGHPAEIILTIDPTQLSQANETIPLWHFDEALGYWKEEGVAVKSGNKYVGEVAHFSWWNCDVPIDNLIILNAKVVDTNGNGIPNTYLKITSSLGSRTAITNHEGNVSGYVPSNESLDLDVIDYCGFTYESFELGSFSIDTTIPDIVVSSGSSSVKEVSGNLINCDDEIVNNGYILLNYGLSPQVLQVNDGNFYFNVLSCESTNNFTLQGFDLDNLQTTGTIHESFSDSEIKNIGTLKACNSIEEFVSYTYDDVTYYHPIISTNLDPGNFTYRIRSLSLDSNSQLELQSNVTDEGTYVWTTSTFFLSVRVGNLTSHLTNYFPVDDPIKFTINYYGEINEYVDISFEGKSRTGVNGVDEHTISGLIHVKRTW